MKIPEELLNSLSGFSNFNQDAFLSVHESGEKLTSLRMNPSKPSQVFEGAERVKWSSQGVYLTERPSFIADPLFHAGCYYVQEASSMFLEIALRNLLDLTQPLKVLDLCAAPGGKSTLINSLLNEQSLLVANEVIKTRVPVLAENLSKWGSANVVVTNNDPKHFTALSGYFDVIVVDAPCSGSGLFRKQPEAIEEWSSGAVNLCSQRQQRILADVLPALKENGVLIYSTCSYSREENEDIGDYLCETHGLEPLLLDLDKDWGIEETHSLKQKTTGYRFYPHRLKGEGFYISCFRKIIPEVGGSRKLKNTFTPLNKQEQALVHPWLKDSEQFFCLRQGDFIHALPKNISADASLLSSSLYLRKLGIELGQIKGKDFIPSHELALANCLNPEIATVEVDRTDALRFLKKEDLRLSAPKNGFYGVKYMGHVLGWVKILPNRVNNYLPKEFRILKNLDEE